MGTNEAALQELCERYGLDLVYSFGSRGREAFRFIVEDEPMPPSASDLDIGVLPSQPLSVRRKVELALALEDLFDVGRVDLVVIPEVNAFLAANIIRGECLYLRDSRQADEYVLYILRRAGDLAPWERERRELIFDQRKK